MNKKPEHMKMKKFKSFVKKPSCILNLCFLTLKQKKMTNVKSYCQLVELPLNKPKFL